VGIAPKEQSFPRTFYIWQERSAEKQLSAIPWPDTTYSLSVKTAFRFFMSELPSIAIEEPMPATFSISLPALITVCIFTSAIVLTNMISLVMIGKINERLPEGKRMSYWGMGINPRKKFKQLYPGNKLVWLHDLCLFLTVISMVGLIRFWVFG
jgi:hypothetical protein